MARQKSIDATNGQPPTPTEQPKVHPNLPKHVRKHIRELGKPRSMDRVGAVGASSPRASEDVEKGDQQ